MHLRRLVLVVVPVLIHFTSVGGRYFIKIKKILNNFTRSQALHRVWHQELALLFLVRHLAQALKLDNGPPIRHNGLSRWEPVLPRQALILLLELWIM